MNKATYILRSLIAVLLLAVAGTAPAAAPAEALATAERLSEALMSGDAGRVRSLLLPEVTVFESGAVEASLAEYEAKHLPADLEFMSKVKREKLSQVSGGDDNTAWVATRSRLKGRASNRELDLDSTETLILRRTAQGWRIAHIHWSSGAHR